MKIGLYGRTGHPVAVAIARGFQLLGHVVSSREQGLHRGEVEAWDLVLVNGMRGGRRIAEAYRAAGVSVLVYDFGYLNRVNDADDYRTGHWQVGVGGLNQLPPFECPADRFEALGLEVAEQGGDPSGYVLVCGQVPGDAAHGQNSAEHQQWLASVMDDYPEAIYRPHPRGGIDLPGVSSDRRPLAEALAGARLVVTYNSNVGHDALLAGVPVQCGGPAAYGPLASDAIPSLEERQRYFAQVAYGQWHPEEMASGEAQVFWLDHLLPGVGPGVSMERLGDAEPGVAVAGIDPSIQPAVARDILVEPSLKRRARTPKQKERADVADHTT